MLKTVEKIGMTQLSLAFSSSLLYLPPHITPPIPLSKPHLSNRGEVLLLAEGVGNGTFFSCNLKSWHTYFTLAPTHTHTHTPTREWTSTQYPAHTCFTMGTLVWLYVKKQKTQRNSRRQDTKPNTVYRFEQSSLVPQKTKLLRIMLISQ